MSTKQRTIQPLSYLVPFSFSFVVFVFVFESQCWWSSKNESPLSEQPLFSYLVTSMFSFSSRLPSLILPSLFHFSCPFPLMLKHGCPPKTRKKGSCLWIHSVQSGFSAPSPLASINMPCHFINLTPTHSQVYSFSYCRCSIRFCVYFFLKFSATAYSNSSPNEAASSGFL